MSMAFEVCLAGTLGYLKIRQGGDFIMLERADVPGLIGALQEFVSSTPTGGTPSNPPGGMGAGAAMIFRDGDGYEPLINVVEHDDRVAAVVEDQPAVPGLVFAFQKEIGGSGHYADTSSRVRG
jgi:hypothetical protein